MGLQSAKIDSAVQIGQVGQVGQAKDPGSLVGLFQLSSIKSFQQNYLSECLSRSRSHTLTTLLARQVSVDQDE